MAPATEQAPATEVNDTSEVVESPAESQATESQETPAAPEAFDPNSIDPQVKEYYAKQYGDYEQVKQAASQFQQLQADPRFNQWAQTLNAPKAPEPFTISPDEHSAALGDPAKFQEIIMRAAERVAMEKFAPRLDKAEKEAQFAKASAELSDVVNKHPEFKELDKGGFILPVLQKYPGISFADALAIAKQSSGWEAKKAAEAAAGQVQTQKKAMTEKPGNPGTTGRGPRHFKTTSEALEWVATEFRAGRQVDPEDWTSDN